MVHIGAGENVGTLMRCVAHAETIPMQDAVHLIMHRDIPLPFVLRLFDTQGSIVEVYITDFQLGSFTQA